MFGERKKSSDNVGLVRSELWNITSSFIHHILAFVTLSCAQTTGYELHIKTQKFDTISYLIGIVREKQVISGYLYQLNKVIYNL